jgi:formylglycine-generating enzyme
MKFQVKPVAFLLLAASLALTACDKKEEDNSSLLLLIRGGGSVYSPGDMEPFTADGVSFKMAYVPGRKTFPTGVDDNGDIDGNGSQDISPTATVANAFWIGETEVTYELWYKVYTWATDAARGANQYNFTFGPNAPREGNDGTPGNVPTNQEPVTYVNWRHAMVWCNALTEWYNSQEGTSYACVYNTDSAYATPLRAADDSTTITWDGDGSTFSGTQDEPFVNPDAKGFRLLTSNEWELAARWRNDATNTIGGYRNPYFTKGNSASGATTYYNYVDGPAPNSAGKNANDSVAVYRLYWDGDSWESTGVTGTAAVKSKTTGYNALGLYDMSGNVWEMCFDWYPGSEGSYRVIRGCSWSQNTFYLQVGSVGNHAPFGEGSNVGFRIARTR